MMQKMERGSRKSVGSGVRTRPVYLGKKKKTSVSRKLEKKHSFLFINYSC